MAKELTDAEVDYLLERFDQTEPSLQRRIVAGFVARTTMAELAVAALVAALSPVEASLAARGVTRDVLAARNPDLPFRVRFTVAELVAVLDAVAKARGGEA